MSGQRRRARGRAARRPYRGGRDVFNDAYARADAILDRGQHRVFRVLWFFLPDTSIARDPRFQQVVASRFFSDAGQQALLYGALVAVVRGGGSAIDAAFIGVAAILPPALFGLFGGAVADALPKRVALALAYNLQAALCLAIPFFAGTDLAAIFFLVFAVNVLGQVSGPTESSVLPLVASREQLAAAASIVSLASNVGTAFGTALLAPVLVRVLGVDAVFFVAGGLLFVAASRVFDLPTRQQRRRFNWRRPTADVAATVRWLLRERAVATMMIVAVLGGTASIVVQTLGPRYVSSVLGVDAADSVYVFAPASIGLLGALVAGPWLIERVGERPVALLGFATTALVLSLLGVVPEIAPLVDRVNPFRLLESVGLAPGLKLRTASFLSVFLGFGLSLTATAVQTYLNRRVPLTYQGRAFALQSVMKNGASIVPLLTVGALATVFGARAVLLVSPLLLLASALALIEISIVLGGGQRPSSRLDVLQTFWEESDAPLSDPDAAPLPEHGHDDEHRGA